MSVFFERAEIYESSSPMQDANEDSDADVVYVGQRVISILVEENGTLFDVIVDVGSNFKVCSRGYICTLYADVVDDVDWSDSSSDPHSTRALRLPWDCIIGFSDKSATCLLLHDRIGQSYATIANSSTYLTNCYPTKVTSAQLILNIDCHVERYSINPDPISRWNQRQ
jgi:hypothetical protein